MFVRTLGCCAIAVVLGCFTGCGGSGTCRVTGTAKLKDGTPLSRGRVIFTGGPSSANGRIQEDGSFTVGTYDIDDGAMAGGYTVVVVGVTEPDTRDHDEISQGIGEEPKSLIHAKYASSETSDLRVEIKAGKNTLTLELDPP